MAVFKFPVLLSESFSSFVTARCVGEEATGFGESSAVAIAQIKEYLQWFYADAWWREPEEFGAATLLEIRVEVRPEYKIERRPDENAPAGWRKKQQQQKKRVFAATETVPLRVACVYRQEENGSYFATLPLLGAEFYFYDLQALKQLATAYVQEKLKGATPLDLSKFLPGKRVWLEEISFNLKRRAHLGATVEETPTLAQVAEPLGAKSFGRKSQKPFERDLEVDDLVRRLTAERANIILLGEAGVGKTTVLTQAVRRVEEDLATGKISFNDNGENYDDDEDEKPPRHRFWQTNGSRLIAGMKYLGQWQERCEEVVTELSNIGGVLCVEKLTDFLTARNQSDSLAAFFMPYLQRGELRMVVEADSAELDACRRLLPGFAELFQVVRLTRFSREKALAVLGKIAAADARNTQIILEQNATGLIYRLFTRFLPYQTFPGKVPSFVRELFEKARQAKMQEITRENVIELFVKTTGLPELFLRDEITLDLKDVVADLETQVIGQPAACQAVANLVTTFKAGLSDPHRPLGVLLFVGQTGVGKTELAKALARFFFGAGERGSEERLIRLDMSEYSLPDSSSRLLSGTGGEDSSELIRKVRQQPFCVVLFDEIEKADAQVFDVLLGLFDEGRLTDRFGRTTNFRSAVVILTSNLGAEKFGSIGFGENALPSFEREAQAFFRPEFFNRLDAVVQFSALDQDSLRQITEKELRAIAGREGLEKEVIKLFWTPEIVDFLARQGSDSRYGARPLQRTIETLVTAPLAKFLLKNPELKNCELTMALSGDRIVFEAVRS